MLRFGKGKLRDSFRYTRSCHLLMRAALLTIIQVNVPHALAQQRVKNFKSATSFPGPSHSEKITSDLVLEAIALNSDGSPVQILHTDGGEPTQSPLYAFG